MSRTRCGSKSSGRLRSGTTMVFVLVRAHRNAVRRHLEEVHRRRRVERERGRLHRGRQARVDLVEGEDEVDRLRLDRRQDRRQVRKREAEELAREQEILAQEIEAAEDAGVVRQQRLARARSRSGARLPSGSGTHDGIAEPVEIAHVDADAIGEELLVERDRVGLACRGDGSAARRSRQPANQASGRRRRRGVRGFVLERGRPCGGVSVSRRPATTFGPNGGAERLQRAGARVVLGAGDVERPQRDVGRRAGSGRRRGARARDRSRRYRSRGECGCRRAGRDRRTAARSSRAAPTASARGSAARAARAGCR